MTMVWVLVFLNLSQDSVMPILPVIEFKSRRECELSLAEARRQNEIVVGCFVKFTDK